MKCEVTKYGKPCTSSVWCLYRKRVYEAGKFVYRHMYVCESHAKNNDRTNDTYENILTSMDGAVRTYSGEASPYWEHHDKQGTEEETRRANPDALGDNTRSPWQSETLSYENEELIKRVRENANMLSFREGQILNLMCYKGMSQVQIAGFLNIKPQAVSNYIKRIKKKMHKLV